MSSPDRQTWNASRHAPPQGRDPRRWKALTVCLAAGFMTLLDVSIVNVALPSIQAGLDASPSALQWVVAGYALAFGLVLVPAGRLGDMRGRRGVFMIGLASFVAASVAAGAAQSAIWLAVARVFQGVAGGLVNPQVIGIIQQLFRGPERGKAFGLLGAVIGISTAVGPLLGGAIIYLGGTEGAWRWIFYVNVPIGLAALGLAWRWIPPASHSGTRHDMDPMGVLLLGAGVLLLLLPFVEARQWGVLRWLMVPGAVLLLALFTRWERQYERRGGEPLVNMGLFHARSYTLGISIATAYFAGFTGIFFILTLYLQEGLGYSALLAGLAMTPFAIGSAAGSWIGGVAIARFGRPVVATGLSLVMVGLMLTEVAVRLHPGYLVGLWIAAPLLLAGIGSGLIISPNQALSLTSVPVRYSGSAGGVLQTGQRIGTALGIAASSGVFFSTLAAAYADRAVAFRHGLWVIIAFVALALCLALVDIAVSKRQAMRTGATPPNL